jgi:hypothetical protein
MMILGNLGGSALGGGGLTGAMGGGTSVMSGAGGLLGSMNAGNNYGMNLGGTNTDQVIRNDPQYGYGTPAMNPGNSTPQTMSMVSNTMGPLGQVIGGIISAIQSQRQSPQSKMEEHRWDRAKEGVGQVFNQSFYNPVMEQYARDVYANGMSQGTNPYAVTPYGAWTEKEAYSWNPGPATQGLYSQYLNRTYGLPESVARAQAAQAMQPTRMPTLQRDIMSPMQASQAFGGQPGVNPQALGQAMLQSRMPAAQREMDYLQNAAQLAAYNLRRAQQLPNLIG